MYKEEITLGMQLERKAEEKGRFLGESDMIMKMYNSNMSIEHISSISGFPYEQIKEILKNNGLT